MATGRDDLAVLGGMADLHAHTTYSDGIDSPQDVVAHALGRCGLELVAITDHDTIEGALRGAEHAARRGWAGRVIVGEEVSTLDGHVLGLFLRARVAPGRSAADTVFAIHAQGGLAVAAHPFWRSRQPRPSGVGTLINEVRFDAVEVANGGLLPDMWRANREARQETERLGLPAVGGSDAHVKEAIGWCHTLFPGATAADLAQAVRDGGIQAGRIRAGAAGIARYIAWGMARRPVPVGAPVA